MATVGSWGGIVFEVSRNKVMGFDDGLQHEGGARLNVTEVEGREPIVDFSGPDSETVSMSMRLLADLGVDPRAEYERLQMHCRIGTAAPLVIGGRPLGGSGVRWIIETYSGELHNFARNGARLIDVSLTLRRYVAVKT